jgi:hypothetical protein
VRLLVLDDILSHHISALFSLHVTTIAIPVAAIPPMFYFVYILVLFVSAPVSFVSILLCTSLVSHMAGCSYGFFLLVRFLLLSAVVISCRGTEKLCGLRLNSHPPLINYVAFAGVITWERSLHITHLISWLVHRSNAHLSLIIWASHLYGMVGNAGFHPSIFRIRLAIGKIDREAPYQIVFFLSGLVLCFFFS